MFQLVPGRPQYLWTAETDRLDPAVPKDALRGALNAAVSRPAPGWCQSCARRALAIRVAGTHPSCTHQACPCITADYLFVRRTALENSSSTLPSWKHRAHHRAAARVLFCVVPCGGVCCVLVCVVRCVAVR